MKKSSVLTSLDYPTLLKDVVTMGIGLWNMKPIKDLGYRHIAVAVAVLVIFSALNIVKTVMECRRNIKEACIKSETTRTQRGKAINFNVSVAIDACKEELKKKKVDALEREVNQILQDHQDAVFAAARTCIKNEEEISKKESKENRASKK